MFLLLVHGYLCLFIVCQAVITTKLQRYNKIKGKHKEVLFFYVNVEGRETKLADSDDTHQVDSSCDLFRGNSLWNIHLDCLDAC